MESYEQHCASVNSQRSDMQKEKNIRLLISLCVLMVCTVAVYFYVSRTATVVVDKNRFKVENLDAIDRVELTSASEKIELKFNGARWRVNDQLANMNMVDVLFATLQQAEPKRPVATTMVDSVSRVLEKHGVTVKLFEGETLRKEFIAGGNVAKTQAYFKDVDTGEVYVMVIPGYRVYTSGVFELDENGWKDKYVFSFNWKNFKQLKASFPNNPKSDFEIEMGKEYFEVKGLAAVDTARLNDFLDAISLTTVDQYIKNEEIKNLDSLLQAKPQLEIEVSDISGKNYQLSLYTASNPNTILGIVNGNQPAYLSKQKVKDLFKERTWFAKK